MGAVEGVTTEQQVADVDINGAPFSDLIGV